LNYQVIKFHTEAINSKSDPQYFKANTHDRPRVCQNSKYRWIFRADSWNLGRYERGSVNPTARVIDYCMNLINQSEIQTALSAGELAAKILNHLLGIGAADARLALDKVIDTLIANQSNMKPTKGKR
jgi:hypothetical protein